MTDRPDNDSARDPEFSYPVSVRNLSDNGLRITLVPDAAARARIAARFGIPSVPVLKGDVTVLPTAHGATVKGHFEAVLTRECVASLESMTENIRETLDIEFDHRVEDGDEATIMAQIEAGVLAEPLDGDEIDLGELLIQQLSLAMDPFPRKPGATALVDTHGRADEPSAFAVLQALKNDKDLH